MAILEKDPSGSFGQGDPSMGAVKSPYDNFNSSIMGLLTAAQGQGSNAPLYAAKDRLINESQNLSNPLADTPYASILRGIAPTGAVDAEKGIQASFSPGITSINDQIQSNNEASNKFNDLAKTALAYKGQYTPAVNPTTGLPDGFNTTSGRWASDDNAPTPSGTTGTHDNGSTLVGGVDFSGAATSTKPYATDTQYTTEVGGLYKSLVTTMPQATVANLDTYIQSHASKSPVSGQMILNAANTYGVDPLLLTSVLAHESDFGTAGKGASTFNPGNVGNTDSGATQTFQSWQSGVNATASELARRMPGNPNAPKPAVTSNVGGEFSDAGAAKLSQLPPYMRSYADAGPKGVAYINDTKVPANIKTAVQAMAAKSGVPYLDATDVANIKAIQNVYQQMDNMQKDINTTLNSGMSGALADRVWAPIAEWVQSPWGNSLKKLASYRDTAIKAVQALAGGQGSGLRINTGEIAANTQSFLPSTTDSIEAANVGISSLRQYLDGQLATTFPYVSQGKPAQTAQNTQSITMSGPKGTYTVSPDKVAIMEQNGYTTVK